MIDIASPGVSVRGKLAMIAKLVGRDMATVHRDIDMFEIFSGCGSMSETFRDMGCQTREFDRLTRCESEDLSTVAGIVHAGLTVLRVKEYGILTAAVSPLYFAMCCLLHAAHRIFPLS
eukprot:4785281-Pyramimonas_sp.AAC.1